MFGKVPVKGRKVCCILSGGNIDVSILSRVIERGLLKSGRTLSIQVELVDKPGQLKLVADVLSKEGANITLTHHEKATEDIDITGTYLRITMYLGNVTPGGAVAWDLSYATYIGTAGAIVFGAGMAQLHRDSLSIPSGAQSADVIGGLTEPKTFWFLFLVFLFTGYFQPFGGGTADGTYPRLLCGYTTSKVVIQMVAARLLFSVIFHRCSKILNHLIGLKKPS